MKKTYICPQIEEIKLKANQTLLAGSVQEDTQGNVESVTIFGESNGYSNEYEIE